MIVQKLKCENTTSLALAEKYYNILSAVNDLKLTQRELQLMAFTAIKGNMTYGNVKEEFCAKYKTTSPTINNLIYKLKKMGMLVKTDGKIKVAEVIALPFKEGVTLEIRMLTNE